MWRDRILLGAVFIFLVSCAENNVSLLHLKSIDDSAYHEDENIPEEYTGIYGKWKLVGISGGLTGNGHETDFDFLEMKGHGIYGLVRNDILFEYGKIELDTFDINRADVLQIKLVPEYISGVDSYWAASSEKYVILDNEVLTLESPCCDMFNHHFKIAQQ